MKITLIGSIVIILSIIAFFKNEDWLLYLTVFFSTFTAAAVFSSGGLALTPFKVPLLLWVLKQIIIFVKSKPKITFEKIKNILKENKIFTALLVFTIVIIISNVWLLISGINYNYYDITYKENRTITFSGSNIGQTRGILEYFAFLLILSLKKFDKEKIRKILNIFLISTICSVLWGFIQFVLYYLNINYPAFLFNNNPGYAQCYDQVMHGIKRINSVATEPSVFALNLIAVIPIILVIWLYDNEKRNRVINSIIVALTIICAILTTSSTAIVGLMVTVGLLAMYLLVKYIKSHKEKKYKIKLVKLILYMILCIAITLVICLFADRISQKINTNKSTNVSIETEKNISKDNTPNQNIPTESTPQQGTPTQNIPTESTPQQGTPTQNIPTESTPTQNDIEENIVQQSIPTQSIVVDNTDVPVKEDINIIQAIKQMTISKLSSGSGQERMEREKLGLEIYKMSPIFGVGFVSFRTFNLFTNILVNMGIIGLISLLYIIYTVLKVIIKNRKKDEKYFLIFILSIIGMLVAFMVSIPDLIYIYFWMILILGYKYFKGDDKKMNEKKEKLIIGIDGRGLDLKKTGITTYISEVIKRLNEIDHKNTYYIYSNRDVILDFELNDNFEIRRYKCKKGTLGYYFKLPKILKQDNVDILWGTQHCLPMRNNYTKDIKFVLTVHDLAIHKLKTVGELKNTIIQRLFLKRSCKHANVIMADSKATKDDIVEIFKIKEDKIKVVYLGTNFTGDYNVTKEQEEEIANKFNIKDKDYLFFLSTIEPRKNIDTAIRAFEKYKEEKKDDLKFIISGGIGWKCEKTLEMIDNSKYKDDIIRTGYITKEEKEYFFKNCKAFLYPSLYEGFGLPVLEAMQKGAVVITSNISSIPEVGGDAALYLNNVYDVEELKKLIEKALTLDEESKKELIQKGYEQVKKFTWEDCAKEVLEIMRG